MNLTDIAVGGIWSAAAVNVLGYVWNSYESTYSSFPGAGEGGTPGGSGLPTIIPPRRKKPSLPKAPPPPGPVPKRVPPPVPRHVRSVRPQPWTGPPIAVPPPVRRPVPDRRPGQTHPGPAIDLPGGIRIPLPDINLPSLPSIPKGWNPGGGALPWDVPAEG